MAILILGYVWVFIFGLVVGSFLNVISDRLPAGRSFGRGRSQCSFCKKHLGIFDLIPLLSFFLLGRKCRYCKKSLSWYYPASEFLTGLLFIFAAYYTNVLLETTILNFILFIYIIIIMSLYTIMFLTDAKIRIIPNKIVYLGIFISIIFMFGFFAFSSIYSYKQLANDAFGKYLIEAGFWQNQVITDLKDLGLNILAGFIISGFFLFLIFITKGRGMGFGDVKLGFLIGLVNGFPYGFLAIFLGFVFGSVYSLVLIGLKIKTMKDVIPFGPFLITGSIVALGWGVPIINWYLALF